MANDLNRVFLIGRLTKDPELRFTQSGTPIANFSLANNRTYTTSAGEKTENVSYFDCIAWSKLGEVIVEYCKKGGRIGVEGRLQQNSWVDKDGNKRYKVEIVVDNFQFLDSKAGADAGMENYSGVSNSSEENNSQIETVNSRPAPDDNVFSDDNIPF